MLILWPCRSFSTTFYFSMLLNFNKQTQFGSVIYFTFSYRSFGIFSLSKTMITKPIPLEYIKKFTNKIKHNNWKKCLLAKIFVKIPRHGMGIKRYQWSFERHQIQYFSLSIYLVKIINMARHGMTIEIYQKKFYHYIYHNVHIW